MFSPEAQRRKNLNIKKVRDVFIKDREFSLHALAMETGESEDILEYLLADWTARGRVMLVIELPSCISGGCSGCAIAYMD